MKKDLHSLAHSFAAGWIRFWFPWVRFLEQDAVSDEKLHPNYDDDDDDEMQDGFSVKAHTKPPKGD